MRFCRFRLCPTSSIKRLSSRSGRGRDSIERGIGAVIGKSYLHRSGFLDLRRDGADSAEIHLQAIIVEPIRAGESFGLKRTRSLPETSPAGRTRSRYCRLTIPRRQPWTVISATSPRALARLDFGHSAQAGVGHASRIQSPEKYKMRISAPVAIVRRRSRRPKARRIREKRLRSDMLYSRLGSAPL